MNVWYQGRVEAKTETVKSRVVMLQFSDEGGPPAGLPPALAEMLKIPVSPAEFEAVRVGDQVRLSIETHG